MRYKIYAAVLLVLGAGPQALGQTSAQVLEVDAVSATLLKTHPPILLVAATGIVPDSGWEDARLVPYVYIVPPADGVWDFSFVATRLPGPHLHVITPVATVLPITDPPDWVKGVRVHASVNSEEVKLGKTLSIDSVTPRDHSHYGSSLSFDAEYESGDGKHCIVVKAKIKLGGSATELELGRYCIDIGDDCVGGTKGVGGFDVKWKLCLRNGGEKLCFSAKVCKDFGFPIGELCTPKKEICVEIR